VVALATLTLFMDAAKASAQSSPNAPSGSVRGRVVISEAIARIEYGFPLVIFLERQENTSSEKPGSQSRTVTISQRNASFVPSFAIVPVGDEVEFPNDDVILHNVFSYSPGNQFDLGLYPKGERRKVRFVRPGVVKVYCSIHASMSSTVFVVPTPHFSRVADTGDFLIMDVPPGRYRLRTMSEALPSLVQDVEVRSRSTTNATLSFSEAAL
jgi:plastocyanin